MSERERLIALLRRALGGWPTTQNVEALVDAILADGWRQEGVVSDREELVEILTGLTITSAPTEAETVMPAGSRVAITINPDGVAELADAILKLATERTLRKVSGREVRRG